MIEVMTETLERDWWRDFRRFLAQCFHQDEVLIRASKVLRL